MNRVAGLHWALWASLLVDMILRISGVCDSPDLDIDKTHDGTADTYQTGDTVTFNCAQGYDYVSGTKTSTCQSSGSWTAITLTCQLGSCPPIQDPDNGRKLSSDYRVTKTIQFECDVGYNLVGSSSTTCYATRTWSQPAPTCVVVTCPSLTITNGQASASNREYNDEVTITCVQGYIYSQPPNTRRCQASGQWTGQDGDCRVIDCGTPVIYLGQYELFNNGATGYAAIASFTCNPGTTREGADGLSNCNDQEQWDPPPPNCNQGCTSPVIENAEVQPGGTLVHGAQVTVDCADGYGRNGAGQLTCQNGTWTPGLPTCVLGGTDSPTPTPTTPTDDGGWPWWQKLIVGLVGAGAGLAIIGGLTWYFCKGKNKGVPLDEPDKNRPTPLSSVPPNQDQDPKKPVTEPGETTPLTETTIQPVLSEPDKPANQRSTPKSTLHSVEAANSSPKETTPL